MPKSQESKNINEKRTYNTRNNSSLKIKMPKSQESKNINEKRTYDTRNNSCLKIKMPTPKSKNINKKRKYNTRNKLSLKIKTPKTQESKELETSYNKKTIYYKCLEPGCIKEASFGTNGKRIYCASHKLPEMMNVKRKICIEQDCNKYAIYGIKTPEYCVKHKKESTFRLVGQICIEPNCNTYASFGLKKPLYCALHKHIEMKNIISHKCLKCDKQASFGFSFKTPEYCASHKLPDMKCLKKSKCLEPNCNKQPYKLKKSKYCSEHSLTKNKPKNKTIIKTTATINKKPRKLIIKPIINSSNNNSNNKFDISKIMLSIPYDYCNTHNYKYIKGTQCIPCADQKIYYKLYGFKPLNLESDNNLLDLELDYILGFDATD